MRPQATTPHFVGVLSSARAHHSTCFISLAEVVACTTHAHAHEHADHTGLSRWQPWQESHITASHVSAQAQNRKSMRLKRASCSDARAAYYPPTNPHKHTHTDDVRPHIGGTQRSRRVHSVVRRHFDSWRACRHAATQAQERMDGRPGLNLPRRCMHFT